MLIGGANKSVMGFNWHDKFSHLSSLFFILRVLLLIWSAVFVLVCFILKLICLNKIFVAVEEIDQVVGRA